MTDAFKRCPRKMYAGPRKGEVCGRRFMAPHKACVLHRDPPPREQTFTPEEVAERNAARRKRTQLRAARTGIPPGWRV